LQFEEALVSLGSAVRFERNAPLAPRTTLRIGGPARWLAVVRERAALVPILKAAGREEIPVFVLGKGSNILVADEGFAGLVLLLEGEFKAVVRDGARIVAGGGASLAALTNEAKRGSLSGVEGLSGIPSTVGGAIRMNAGAHGVEIFDVLDSIELVGSKGESRIAAAGEIPHGYRTSDLQRTGELVVSATLGLCQGDPAEIERKMKGVLEKRGSSLPSGIPNAGSFFKNPPGQFAGRLLEECGFKGRCIGAAGVSGIHANVIVNLGGATAKDVLELAAAMAEAVRERFGVTLEREVQDLKA